MDLGKEIIRSIQVMIDKKLDNYRADRTFKTVIRKITSKGYIITDETGSERIVKCSIPGVTLKPGQMVWVKEPMGDLKGLHICGVAVK
jgi:hypothetical protein